jgi:site-specific DNA-methyltransferase (adenine-specific)
MPAGGVEQIGTATLYLGDCLEILPTLGKADAVVTDPPYSSGARNQADTRSIFRKGRAVSKETRTDEWFLGDNMGSDTYLRWQRQIARVCCDICTPGSPSYVFTDWRQYTNIVTAWETCLWTLRSVVVWDKNKGGAMGLWWRNNHEWICVFTKGKPRPLPHHSFFNTWKGCKPQGGEHPTEKPIELIKYLVETVPVNGMVLDPFMGSGTTGIACVELGRKFISIEINEKYFDIACKRIEEAVKQYEQT